MSMNLNELIKAQLEESKRIDIKEQLKRISEKLKDQEITVDWKNSNGKNISETLKKLVESQNKLENTISEAFPNIDAKKFTSLLINSPIHNSVSFSTTLKLLNHLNSISPIYERIEANADLYGNIEVVQRPTEEKESKLSIENYFLFFVAYIFPFIQLWISCVQNTATTEQLNEIQNQLNELTQIVEIHEAEHSTDFDIHIEGTEDFSGGVKT